MGRRAENRRTWDVPSHLGAIDADLDDFEDDLGKLAASTTQENHELAAKVDRLVLAMFTLAGAVIASGAGVIATIVFTKGH